MPPPVTSPMSKLVPPMSTVIRLSTSSSLLTCSPALSPATGPACTVWSAWVRFMWDMPPELCTICIGRP